MAQRLGLFLSFRVWTRHYHTGDVNEHVSARLQALVLRETTTYKCKRVIYIFKAKTCFMPRVFLSLILFHLKCYTLRAGARVSWWGRT